MRIVNSLDDILTCPNCGTRDLHWTKNKMGRDYLFCSDCHEEIYENETTCSEEKAAKKKESYCLWDEGMNTIKEVREEQRKKKEGFIFEMREEVSHLTWCIHDSKTQTLVENIQNIFNRIIDYIEEN